MTLQDLAKSPKMICAARKLVGGSALQSTATRDVL